MGGRKSQLFMKREKCAKKKASNKQYFVWHKFMRAGVTSIIGKRRNCRQEKIKFLSEINSRIQMRQGLLCDRKVKRVTNAMEVWKKRMIGSVAGKEKKLFGIISLKLSEISEMIQIFINLYKSKSILSQVQAFIWPQYTF